MKCQLKICTLVDDCNSQRVTPGAGVVCDKLRRKSTHISFDIEEVLFKVILVLYVINDLISSTISLCSISSITHRLGSTNRVVATHNVANTAILQEIVDRIEVLVILISWLTECIDKVNLLLNQSNFVNRSLLERTSESANVSSNCVTRSTR